MDLTCSLQVTRIMQQPAAAAVTGCVQGEVEQWEDKVKSLKEELSQLETQKKGLEAILRKHSGTCKVFKSGLYTQFRITYN